MKRAYFSLILLLLMTAGVQTVRAGVPDDMKYQMVNSYDNTTWDGFSLWDGKSMMNYVDENGLIYITNAAQLAKYAHDLYGSSAFSGRNVCLDCNIDLGGYKFQIARNGGNAYGTGDDMVCFEGQNHIIRNGKAFSESANFVFSHYNGLFSEIKCARIQNLIVDNYTIEIGDYDDRTDRNACGIICGSADICTNRPNSVISNCRVMNSSVTGDIHYAGGIIGYGACDIYDCAVINSTISTLDDTAGGIAGGINTLDINKTKISGNRVINCSVTAKDDHVGGLIGFIRAHLTIEKNYVLNSTVKITAGDNVGGLVGIMARAGDEGWGSFTIRHNWVDATVSGNEGAKKGSVIGDCDRYNQVSNNAYSNYWNKTKCPLGAVSNEEVDERVYQGMTAQQMTNEMYISGFTKWAHVYPMQQDQTTSDIVVTTADQLRQISDQVKIGYTYEGRTIRLANDINVSNGNIKWEPIGCASADNSQIHPFMGRFDGQGHTISGLTTTETSYDYRGLFGLVINAHISNVQIAGPNISTTGKYVGGAVGWVYGGSCYVGQVMVNNATITARSSAGGVMGRSSDDAYSTIEDCQVWGTSKVSASQVDSDTGADGRSGGIVGNIHAGEITDCGSTATILGKKTGLVGGCEHAIAITRCYAVSYNNTNLVSVGMNNATITDCPAEVSTGEGMKSTLGTEKWYYFSNGDRHPIPSALKIYVDDTGIVVDNGVVYEANYDGGNISSYDVIGYQGSGGAVEIPDDINGVPVDWVYRKAFSGNETITSITIGNNVRACYFEDLPNLTSLTLGSRVGAVSTQIYNSNPGREMIKKCPKLTTISVNESNTHMIVVDGLLYSQWKSIKNGNIYAWELLRCPVGKAGKLTLPSTITNKNETLEVDVVSDLAFEDCNLLTGIIMPETLRDGAQNPSPFNNNTALQYLDLRACTNWTTVWNTNRGADATGFFTNVPENTLIYLPNGHTLADSKYGHNVIIGGTAQGTQPITLTDGVDFCPKTNFTAPNGVTNDRILVPYATQDGDNVVNTPRGYTVCLPYDLTLSDANVKVYKPSTSTVDAGVTTITFEEVEGGSMGANKPYYVVVSSGSASLSTTASVTFTTTQTGGTNSEGISDYEFKGTLVKIPNAQLYNADKPTYILQSDGKWYQVPSGVEAAYVGAYRAYFQATAKSGARSISMAFDEESTTAVQRIHTIDADGTERYYDLNGRLLPGKPQKGVYIMNGKKYVNK